MRVWYNGAPCISAQPWWVLVTMTLVAFTILLGIGCKKAPVVVKPDTPEAAASTLVRLYAAEQLEGLDQVVDPALLPIEAPRKACRGAISRSYRCLEELMRARLEGGSVSSECMNGPGAQACTCGETGTKAVAAAGGYLNTDAHGVLRDAHLDADKCKVTNVKEIDKAGVSKVVSFFSESVCASASSSDRYTSVEIKCGDDLTIAFMLREQDGKWRLLALDNKTVARWALTRHE